MNKKITFTFFLIILTLLSACENEDNKGKEETLCKIISFNINAVDNPIEEDIVFELDSINRKIVGSYLKWIDASYPIKLIPTFDYVGGAVFCNQTELVSGKSRIDLSNDIIAVH